MRFDLEGRSFILRDSGAVIAEYVFAPVDPQRESPRPYALLRTRSGREVTAYRPEDHVWHRGISLALPVVGTHNFWGGPTYVHGEGYVQRANNGAQVHRRFVGVPGEDMTSTSGVARIGHELDWMSEGGLRVLHERRSLTARGVDDDSWALTWRSELTNVTDSELSFGSPTSMGRDNAGYGGIFWRGPQSFTGGHILSSNGTVDDAARGIAGQWLAYIAPDSATGVLMIDADPRENPWFARSAEYAGLGPAPFFYTETVVAPGNAVTLAAALVVGTGDVADVAPTLGVELVAQLQGERADGPDLGRTE